MTEIFVSYRRSDSEVEAGRLADQLQFRYGDEAVFYDRGRDAFAPGDDWLNTITQAARTASVMLVVIGPTWLEVPDGATQPRIFNDDDIVRLEIKLALSRGARVIPVVLGDAGMPSKNDLPSDLKRLGAGQAVPVRIETFQRDVDYLVEEIEPALGSSPLRSIRRLVRANALLLTVLASMVVAVSAALVISNVSGAEGPVMDGEFNIAVAPFDSSDLPDTLTDGEDVGRSIGEAVAGAIEQSSADTTLVWGPEQVASVSGKTVDAQRGPARQLAKDLDADVIVHGYVEDNGLNEARVVLALTIFTPDQRRPVSPSVLQHGIETVIVGDVKRIDTAEDARENLATLDSLDALLSGVRLLDRGDLDEARTVFEQLIEATGGDTDRSVGDDFTATTQTLLGLVHLRLNESGDADSLPLAVAALEEALRLDPDFAFAELTLLGSRYLELLGGVPSAFDPMALDPVGLGELKTSLLDFVDGRPSASLISLQARNLVGAIDLALAERAGSLDQSADEFLAAAESTFLAVEDDGDPAANPDQSSLIAFTRSSLGQIEFLRGDIGSSIEWYERALQTATPQRQFELRLTISGLLAQDEQPCEAADYAESALRRLPGTDEQQPDPAFVDYATRLSQEQRALCPAT